jgi:hypothetical protein
MSALRSNNRPSTITIAVLSLSRMSASGLPSSTTRSACLPASSEPSCLPEADVVGAVDGRRAQGFEVAEAALGQHPDFPVHRQALHLAVAAGLDAHAGIAQALGGLGHFDVEVVPVRRGFAADRRGRRAARPGSSGSGAALPTPRRAHTTSTRR